MLSSRQPFMLCTIYNVYSCILLPGIVVVSTVQTEAYQLEGIHKEKEGTHTNNCTRMNDSSPISMKI